MSDSHECSPTGLHSRTRLISCLCEPFRNIYMRWRHSAGSPPNAIWQMVAIRALPCGRGACANFMLQSAALIKTCPTEWSLNDLGAVGGKVLGSGVGVAIAYR